MISSTLSRKCCFYMGTFFLSLKPRPLSPFVHVWEKEKQQKQEQCFSLNNPLTANTVQIT